MNETIGLSSTELKELLHDSQNRLRNIKLLRELIANASESLEFARTTSFREVGKGSVPPEGLDAALSRLEGLKEKYVSELIEACRKQELIENWAEGRSLREKELIRFRYFLGNSVEKCAEHFDCSTNAIFRWCKALIGETYS